MKPARNPTQIAKDLLSKLSPRQRQYVTLAVILAGGVGLLWLVFSLTESKPKNGDTRTTNGLPSTVTNIGVMPPGGQVNPVDQWVGNAGRKLAQYESEREEQGRMNKDRQTFESKTMQRFADLEQKLTSTQQAVATPPPPVPAPPSPTTMPPAASLPTLPPPVRGSATSLPTGSYASMPPTTTPAFGVPNSPFASSMDSAPTQPAVPATTRISLADRSKTPSAANSPNVAGQDTATSKEVKTVSSYLPVSFTRGTLLGGLDAPTGGQSQSNPHPVLIRLSDNSILPNRFRGEYRDCFVVAAGYGDISSERAYLRTESLSCVRTDGATLEVKIQGSVYGEDGKVGMRGRLVTKQGQMLANALLAGVVSGIGQGLATSSTEYSTSALGTVASATGADAYRAGVGTGVGRALDRLAQYYIKLAENTFPVIEVDAGREIDVVITKGVRIDVPMTASQAVSRTSTSPETRYLEAPDDANY